MYKHYLNFLDLPLIGKIEISEPFKFDGSTHEIKREKGRHSRDVIIANQDIELEFYREHFEPIEVEQVLPDGTLFTYASHGFDYLVNEINTKGWEMRVEYTINYDGTDFTTGEIDGLTYKVFDDYLQIKISQNTLSAYIKKNDSVKIDAFSDKSLTGLPIEPCATHSIFLKAKPLLQKSNWNSPNVFDVNLDAAGEEFNSRIFYYYNNCQSVLSYGIEDTLTFFSQISKASDFGYLKARNDLSGVKVRIKNLNFTQETDVGNGGNGYCNTHFYIRAGFDLGNIPDLVYDESLFLSQLNEHESFNFSITEQTIVIPFIPQGAKLWIYFRSEVGQSAIGVGNERFDAFTRISPYTIDITATSTAISTIVKGVRLYDLLRHQANSYDTTLNDLGVFNNSSEYWNNFCFNGRMLGNLANQAFNNEFKTLYNSVCDEAFADYQIDNTGITIDFIDNYYKDEELAVFTELPANDANYTANSDYSINIFNLKFKKSSSERTNNDAGTVDDVHTELQLKMPSKKADAVLNIELDHIRSAYLIEEQRKKGNENEGKTKVLENDENLFLLDCVPLPPDTYNEFTQFLRYRILEYNAILEVLSNTTFLWTNLGMEVGQIINISLDGGLTNYNLQLYYMDSFLIRLSFINYQPTADENGERSLTFKYILQGVEYINRTNQDFTNIEGVANPENYSNLKYSLKRILNKWSKVINTAGQFLIGKEANVTEIKINNELVTQITGENSEVIDFAPVTITEDRLLNGRVYEVKVFCDFDKATELFQETRDLKGYVRAVRNNNSVIRGFIKNARYTWRSNELMLTLEEKQDNLITELNTLNIFNYNIVNNFVNLYDANNNLLLNTKEYQFFSINGVIYDNVDDFTNNLIPLLNE